MKQPKRILIAGIGNIFLGDDAFGSEVARELMGLALPDGVTVSDFGIRSYDLAYALMDGVDAAILVDAASRGGRPGTIYLIEPTVTDIDSFGEGCPDAHSMSVVAVLKMVRSFGGGIDKIYLIGCEPATLETEDGQFGLSETVQAAVPKAIETIQSLVSDLLSKQENAKMDKNTEGGERHASIGYERI
jgi:hydrogenase maturation protease